MALGVMTFGTPGGPNAALQAAIARVSSQDLAREIIAKAFDAGINHFNTANVYTGGDSEQMLGKALGSRRKDVVISTKVGGRLDENVLHAGLSRRHILESADESLRRLGTDYIDVYLVHRMDPYTPVEETLEALHYLSCMHGQGPLHRVFQLECLECCQGRRHPKSKRMDPVLRSGNVLLSDRP